MNNPALIITPAIPAGYSIGVTPEWVEAKDGAISTAGFITEVTSPAEQEEAIAAAATLKGFANQVEATREQLKKPFWDTGKAIDAAAKAAAEPVAAEVARLEGLVADYQRKERAKAEEVRREQERIARELEERRRAAEQATIQEGGFAMEEEPVSAPLAAPAPPPAQGAAVRVEYDYEVTDVNALYAWNRAFVKLEDDRSLLKRHINTPGVSHNIPGIKITESTKVAVRASKQS